MAKILVMSVYDIKIESYGPPFFALAIGQASRIFEDSVNAADSPLGKHPEDYRLFHIGYFDESDGSLISLEKPSVVREAVDCMHSGTVRSLKEAFNG